MDFFIPGSFYNFKTDLHTEGQLSCFCTVEGRRELTRTQSEHATHCTTWAVRTVVHSGQADDRFRGAIMCQQFLESLSELVQNDSRLVYRHHPCLTGRLFCSKFS